MALTDGLLAYYKLDTNSNDVFGTNGTDTAVTYSSGNGKVYQGAGFNGTTSKTVVDGLITLLSGQTQGTISFWINCTATVDERVIFCLSTTSGSISEFVIDLDDRPANNYLRFIIYKDGAILLNVVMSASLTTVQGTWGHIALTSDGTTLRWYKNGVADTTFVNSNWFKTIINDAANKATKGRFGCLHRAGSDIVLANAKFDEFGIWNRPLSINEIKDLYAYGSGSQYPFNDKAFLSF